jgi:hypothetical protein
MSLRSRRSDRRVRTRRSPSLEALEGRQLLSLGPEFTVNTTTINSQFDPDVASSSDGMSVVVWTNSNSPSDQQIRAQIYNRSEQKQGPEILVAGSLLSANSPSVAMDPQGNFVVAWRQTEPGGDTNVLAQRFNASGARVGGVVSVGVGTFKEHDPDVAIDAFGRFTVAYVRDTNNSNPDVFAKRYDASNDLVNVFNVGTSSGVESRPSIAMTPDGRFDVAYNLFSDHLNNALLARYSSGGAPLGTNLVGFDMLELDPSVAMDDSGNAVVAYQRYNGSDFNIEARRVTSAGSLGPELNIQSTSANDTSPSVALKHGGGGFVVAYDSSTRVKVTQVSASDTVVATYDAGSSRTGPAVSIDGFDRYMLTDTSTDLTSSGRRLDIKGRFGSLFSLPIVIGPPIGFGLQVEEANVVIAQTAAGRPGGWRRGAPAERWSPSDPLPAEPALRGGPVPFAGPSQARRTDATSGTR